MSEGQEEMDVSAQAEIELVCPSPFCSILVLSELVDDHPCLGGPSALLSLPTDANLFQEHPHKHN